jgi:hypothetical protein
MIFMQAFALDTFCPVSIWFLHPQSLNLSGLVSGKENFIAGQLFVGRALSILMLLTVKATLSLIFIYGQL